MDGASLNYNNSYANQNLIKECTKNEVFADVANVPVLSSQKNENHNEDTLKLALICLGAAACAGLGIAIINGRADKAKGALEGTKNKAASVLDGTKEKGSNAVSGSKKHKKHKHKVKSKAHTKTEPKIPIETEAAQKVEPKVEPQKPVQPGAELQPENVEKVPAPEKTPAPQKPVETEAAQKAKTQINYKEKLETEIKQFETSLNSLTDENLEQLNKELINENLKLRENGIKKWETRNKRPWHGGREYDWIELLSDEEKFQYDLIQSKSGKISNEKCKREDLLLQNLLHKPTDMPVNTKWAYEYCNDTEHVAINAYHDDYRCNYALRKGGGDVGGVSVSTMDALFKKAPPLEEEAVVYRSVSGGSYKTGIEFINSIKTGKIIDNPAYVSTATSCTDALFKQYACSALEGDGVLMRIHLPKGTKGVLSGHNEYLLPRGTKLKVLNLENINGVKVAECEYILPEKL